MAGLLLTLIFESIKMTDKSNDKTNETTQAAANAKPSAAEAKETLKGLSIDSKLPDEATVSVCAKHLRMMKIEVEGLDDKIPDWRPVRAPVGKVRKALAAANK